MCFPLLIVAACRRYLLVVFAVLTAAVASAAGTNDAARFDEANRLFEQGRFTEAAAAYEAILHDRGASAAVYFNLGNAWFRTNQLGRAIVNYRLAERLAPRDPDVQANLQFARRAVRDGNPPVDPGWKRQIKRMTLNEWTVAAAVAAWSWLLVLALRQWRPEWRPTLSRPQVALAVATAFLIGGVVLAWGTWAGTAWVVVGPREAVLRRGPLDESPSIMTLHDGQELEVLDEKDGWLRVGGASRGTGWVRQDQVLVLPK